ncbi:MAG: AbrB/MazE/SpoVT family DNA-binding domain-containing protein [Ignavibacteriales bacterium]|nr:AbrB/MazE/SpoVT family DNA-binding domain-containing protein [Ignavibacteriales bacterium]
MAAIKIGASRQVAIPKKIHEELHLRAGDYLEIELRNGTLVLTPKALIDKHLEERLSEAFEDIKKGRVHGPFESGKKVVQSLRRSSKRPKKN